MYCICITYAYCIPTIEYFRFLKVFELQRCLSSLKIFKCLFKMLLLSVPWHPNLSCVPHHAFFLPPPEKGFHSATSQMSGGDAPLKMCNGDLLLKVYWKILGAAAGGEEAVFSYSRYFFWLSEIWFRALISSEEFCQNPEMAHKATKSNVSPFTEWNMLLMWKEFEGSYSRAGQGWQRGQTRAQVIGQIHGYGVGPRKSHLLCVILFSTEMSDLLNGAFEPFPLQLGSPWALALISSSENCFSVAQMLNSVFKYLILNIYF